MVIETTRLWHRPSPALAHPFMPPVSNVITVNFIRHDRDKFALRASCGSTRNHETAERYRFVPGTLSLHVYTKIVIHATSCQFSVLVQSSCRFCGCKYRTSLLSLPMQIALPVFAALFCMVKSVCMQSF